MNTMENYVNFSKKSLTWNTLKNHAAHIIELSFSEIADMVVKLSETEKLINTFLHYTYI